MVIYSWINVGWCCVLSKTIKYLDEGAYFEFDKNKVYPDLEKTPNYKDDI